MSALRAKQSKNEVKIFQDNLDNQPKYSQNQAVFARNFGRGARWLPGVIVKIISPRNYDVKVGDVMWKRHEEQLRPRHIPSFGNTEQAKSEMEQNLFPETKTETNKRETIPAHTEERIPAVPSEVTNEFDTFTPVRAVETRGGGLTPTSYPGSFRYAPRWRKDPGPGWSRVSQILGDNNWDLWGQSTDIH